MKRPRVGLALGSGSACCWAHTGVMEFHRAKDAIAGGRASVEQALPMLRCYKLTNG